MDNSNEIFSWVDKSISYWLKKKVELQDAANSILIKEAEKILDFRFPQDFLEFYKKINGFKDYDWNEYMFSIWPIERILKEHEESEDKNFIGFCDYLINSHCIGFLKTDNGIFKSYEQSQPIASTFEEVIALINNNSALLY